jgi:methylase of polypeptide subunit release factors
VAGPPDASQRSLVEELRDTLGAAGYTHECISELVPEPVAAARRAGWQGPLRDVLSGGSPLDVLVGLFTGELDLAEGMVAAAFGGGQLDRWARLGLVAVDDGSVRPLIGLQPVTVAGDRLVVARDLRLSEPRADEVMGFAGSSMLLAQAMIRRRAKRALDVGTGGGAQAILASRFYEHVVGVDRSARAIDFARFNLLLNNVTNVELCEGDRFAPVAEQRFDLVIANPPFVVSPVRDRVFRDGGLPRDEMTASVVIGAGRHLAPGGWAVVVGNWITPAGGAWDDGVRFWVAASGCDGWAIEVRSRDAMGYVVGWISEEARIDPADADERFATWMEYLRAEKVAAVGYGLVVLHRGAGGRRWFRSDRYDGGFATPCDGAIVASFEATDWLAGPTDDALGEAIVTLASDAALGVEYRPDGGWAEQTLYLTHREGLRRAVEVSRRTADFLGRCDGTRTLAALQAEWAVDTGAGPEEAVALLTTCRELIESGFLVPAGTSTAKRRTIRRGS